MLREIVLHSGIKDPSLVILAFQLSVCIRYNMCRKVTVFNIWLLHTQLQQKIYISFGAVKEQIKATCQQDNV
jgi:hypothetical protein